MHNNSLTRRLLWRLFYCLVIVLVAALVADAAPNKTTISDVIYRADGTPASGSLVISWPAFSTSDHAAVAAGSLDVPIGTGGAIDVALVPNEGATPAGTYYKVVLQLENGGSSVEYWTVPATSPVKIEQVRTAIAPATVAMQAATRQYVDAALASVVHTTGAETITGQKEFETSPLVPTPTSDDSAVNKAYVDSGRAGGGGSVTAGKGIDITGNVVSVKPAYVQTSIQPGDTRSNSAGDFASHYVIPAGTLEVGDVVEIWAAGTETVVAGENHKYSVKLGGTTVLPAAGMSQAAVADNAWSLQARLIVTAIGTSGEVEAQGVVIQQNGGAVSNLLVPNTSTVAVNTTVDQPLTIALAGTVSTGGSSRMRQLIVKILK